MAKILIIGCGDIGGAVASQLLDEGHQVTGLKRSIQDDLSGCLLYTSPSPRDRG